MSDLVPDGWIISSIHKTCDILDSKRIPLNSQERALRKGDYPYYGANGVQGYINDFIFEGEHILLAEDGGNFDQWQSRSISYLVSGKFWVNNHAHILKAKQGQETKFIHYNLVHKNILKHINGGTRAKLNQADMRDISILLPPLPEQQKIAKILTSVDEVIEKIQAQIDKLKDLKTGMMQALLTNGIGNHGKPHTKFKDSPVGKIPAEWSALALNQVAKLSRGRFSHRPRNDPNFYSGQYPFLQTGDIPKESPYIINFSQSLNEKGLGVSKMFSIGTLVITIAATIGEIGILKFSSCFPDSLVGIEVKKDIAEPMFILYVMRYFKNELEALAPQTAQKNINLDILAPFMIPVPPITEQKLIANSLMSLDRNIEKHREKLVQLKNTKKALMQDLLTGKVRVNVEPTA